MRIHKVLVRAVVAFTACLLTWHALPAAAQSGGNPLYIRATPAAKLARYYAPYALQAAAAYLDIWRFDKTLGPNQEPPLDGSDVKIAVEQYADPQNPQIVPHAANILQTWQYQFGSGSYLECYDANYGDKIDSDCKDAFAHSGWRTWSGNPGPVFQVWAKTRIKHQQHDACTEVSVAFRGTDEWNSSTIAANADLIVGGLFDDYYQQLKRNVDAIIRKITHLDCYKVAHPKPQIVSVGHSLGGGLAQFFALAGKTGPRIAKVFAFDPSPVTGANHIDGDTRDQNAKGLTIDRIYQTGEVLQLVRKAYEILPDRITFPKSSRTCDPVVRSVVYDAVPGTTSIGLHNMPNLAAQIIQAAYDNETEQSFTTPRLTNCPTRYRTPPTDEEEGTPVANLSSGRVRYGSSGGAGTIAQISPYGPIYAYATEQGGSPAKLTTLKIRHLAKMPARFRGKLTHTASF